jgi:hypothetical protein
MPDTIQFSPLNIEQLTHMDRQRAFVSQFVATHLPNRRIIGTEEDFAVLQTILDSGLINKEDTWKLQSLGIIFGDVLITTIDGLAWWEVSDKWGTDPVLRYRTSTLQMGVMTMISKRVEDGSEVNVKQLAEWLAEFVHTKANEFQ